MQDNSGDSGTSSLKKCPLCSKPRVSHKNPVVDGTSSKRIYKCCRCTASKLTAKKFLEHTHNHITKRFSCDICRKGFSQKRFLDRHIFIMHGEGQNQRFHCHFEHCNFEAKYPQTLASHIKDKHEGQKRSHKSDDSKSEVTCNWCRKTLKKWYYHMYHKASCHSGVVFKCDFCGQVRYSF